MTSQYQNIFQLCDLVRESSFSLHSYLRHGHLESVYERGLENRLRKLGLKAERQLPLQVFDEDGTILGDFKADLLVEDHLLIELKAVTQLAEAHTAQVLGYLRASRIEHGLLINFGSPKLEIRKYVLSESK